MLLIENGVDKRVVQKLLGHLSIATTEIYTHVSDETLRRTFERANVLGTLALRHAGRGAERQDHTGRGQVAGSVQGRSARERRPSTGYQQATSRLRLPSGKKTGLP